MNAFKSLKRILLCSTLIFSSATLHAGSKVFEGFDEGQQGLSIFLGQPSFLRYDYWLGSRNAVFVDAGYSFDKFFYAAVNAAFYTFNTRDYLTKRRGTFWNSLQFYFGPGFFIGFSADKTVNDSFKMGIRAFGGVEYLFDRQRFSIRAELAPVFFLQGSTFAGVQGALGLTYYFGSKTALEKSAPAPVVGSSQD